MARSWSDAARAAFDAYPWRSPAARARAREETELVSFGEQVETDDLPLAVRQWTRRQAREEAGAAWRWHGESWAALTEAFESAILAQALAAHGGRVAAAARALATTPRVVAYKARKYGLIPLSKQTKQSKEKDS